MAYTWKGMRVLSLDEVDRLYRENSLGGYYILYPDNTEAMIEDISLKEIIKYVNDGCKFGEERPTTKMTLPDGKVIMVPDIVDVSELTPELDEFENNLWYIIEDYLVHLGIGVLDSEPDWATVKGLEDKLYEILESSGVVFKS